MLNLPPILRRKCSHGTTRKFREIQSLPFSGLFAKLCGFKRESVIASQKILRTEVHKVWRKWGFFMRFGPFFYNKRKARQDKMFILTLMLYYYQYARPNDKLPSVKRAFLRAKREMCGMKIHLPPWWALMLTGCRDVKQLRSANEILRIPFQCQSWREFCRWALAHFVALQWTFDVWRFYFKVEEVPDFQLFSSQNSNLDYE